MVAVALTGLFSLIGGIVPFAVKGVLWVFGFKEELDILTSTLRLVQDVLTHINEVQSEQKAMQTWSRDVKDAVYDAEDLLEKLADALRQDRVSRTYYETCIHLNMEELNRRFDRIRKFAQSFLQLIPQTSSTSTTSGLPPTSTSTSQVDKSTLVGRENDTDNIVNMLLDSNYDSKQGSSTPSVFRIVGMAGMGKTTLAQLVFDDPRIELRFPEKKRIWVCASATANFDLSRILREIMNSDPLTRTTHTAAASSSADMLHRDFQKFISGRLFFLVLDDVWTDTDDEEWVRLLFLLKGGAKESRVVVTSQKTGTGLSHVPYKLEPMSPDDCWSLFQLTAFGQAEEVEEEEGNGNSSRPRPRPRPCPPDLEDSGRNIVTKCGNLPLAVRSMAAFLRRNLDPAEWQRISELELWKAEQTVSASQKPNILPALKISYNHLPFYLKPLFSYCSIFPRGYLFHKKHLVQLWIAEGLIDFQRHERAEEIAGRHFDELLMRFFFQTSNVGRGRYVMHDLFHELAKSISDPYFCLVPAKNYNTSRWQYYYNFTLQTHHVSLVCEDVEQPLLEMTSKSEKVRTLLLPMSDNPKVFSPVFLNDGLGGMHYIRVLDLSSSTIQQVPNSIEKLTMLRYLNLSKTGITMLPDFVCELYNLQTLLLLGCASLSKLPKNFAKLTKLQHLELDEDFWLCTTKLPPRIGTLTSLRNLHKFPIRRKAGYRIDELKDMAYLTGTLHISNLENAGRDTAAEAELNKKEYLDKLVLEWSSTSSTNRSVAAAQKEAEKVVKVLEGLQPHSGLKELKINHFRGTAFPSWMTNNGQLLRNLVAVSLKDHTRCKVLSLGELPHLVKLKMKRMKELEELHEQASGGGAGAGAGAGAAGGGSYSSLTLLKISDCPNLKKLPSHFPKLEDLKISYCPKLEALPQKFAPKKLEICGCKLLRGLPAPEYSKQLQHLGLHECVDGTLVGEIPETSSLKSLVVSNIAKAISFPKWPHLPGLEALHIRGCNDLVSLSSQEASSVPFQQSLTSLKFLSIQACSQLGTLTNDEGLPTTLEFLALGSCPNLLSLGPDNVFKSLVSLQDLDIKDCPKLESLPKEGFSTSLQHLVIVGCPALIARCRKDSNGEGPDWPKIMHIRDREIDFIGVSSSLDLTKQIHWPHYFMQWKGGKIGKSKSAKPLNLSECAGTSKAKEQAEPPNYAEGGGRFNGKELAEPSNLIEHGGNSEGKDPAEQQV